MTKTIAVSEEVHQWISSFKRFKMETMNEVLERIMNKEIKIK